jgi:hypothetical protein
MVMGLVLLLGLALVAGSLQLMQHVRRRQLEHRRLRIYLEEQLTRRRIDALTWATLRAMRQIADDYQRSDVA